MLKAEELEKMQNVMEWKRYRESTTQQVDRKPH